MSVCQVDYCCNSHLNALSVLIAIHIQIHIVACRNSYLDAALEPVAIPTRIPHWCQLQFTPIAIQVYTSPFMPIAIFAQMLPSCPLEYLPACRVDTCWNSTRWNSGLHENRRCNRTI